jgi:hypothetical protein
MEGDQGSREIESRMEELVESFRERCRKGERPKISEYIEKYPDLAERIREVFPPLILREEARLSGAAPSGVGRFLPPRVARSRPPGRVPHPA